MQRPCNLDWQGLICTESETWSTVHWTTPMLHGTMPIAHPTVCRQSVVNRWSLAGQIMADSTRTSPKCALATVSTIFFNLYLIWISNPRPGMNDTMARDSKLSLRIPERVELETSSHVDEPEPCLRLRGRALQPRLMQCNATRCGGWIFHEQGRGGQFGEVPVAKAGIGVSPVT